MLGSGVSSVVEFDLIAKKDLLDMTGISYGQLYRWKRKNLIPEDWFIRKSTFTGQETFFPKERILQRIEQILSLKDDKSLDELADIFSLSLTSDILLSLQELLEQNIVTSASVSLYVSIHPFATKISFHEILCLSLVDFSLKSGEIHRDEASMLLHMLLSSPDKLLRSDCSLWMIRKLGISTCFLVTGSMSTMTTPSQEIIFEPNTRVVFSVETANFSETLRAQLNGERLLNGN